MAYDPTKLVTLKNLKDTATRIKTEYLAAISKAGHARFQNLLKQGRRHFVGANSACSCSGKVQTAPALCCASSF